MKILRWIINLFINILKIKKKKNRNELEGPIVLIDFEISTMFKHVLIKIKAALVKRCGVV